MINAVGENGEVIYRKSPTIANRLGGIDGEIENGAPQDIFVPQVVSVCPGSGGWISKVFICPSQWPNYATNFLTSVTWFCATRYVTQSKDVDRFGYKRYVLVISILV